MKTKLISKLKKELLIVELPEGTDMKDPIQILKNKGNHLVYSKHNGHIISRNKLPDGEWTLLGTPDEIKEDDIKDLVKKVKDYHVDDFESMLVGNSPMTIKINKRIIVYKSYLNDNKGFSTALESFNSALESEIYWENPLGHSSEYYSYIDDERKWHEAQEKTFDRNRSIILVKN